jgi:hypothetical protein
METADPIIDLVEKETGPTATSPGPQPPSSPCATPPASIVGTFGISRDVTARKVAEQRLHVAQHELVTSAKRAAISEFAASVLAEALGLLSRAKIKTERIRVAPHAPRPRRWDNSAVVSRPR